MEDRKAHNLEAGSSNLPSALESLLEARASIVVRDLAPRRCLTVPEMLGTKSWFAARGINGTSPTTT